MGEGDGLERGAGPSSKFEDVCEVGAGGGGADSMIKYVPFYLEIFMEVFCSKFYSYFCTFIFNSIALAMSI